MQNPKWFKKQDSRVVPIAMQSFSQGIPNDPNYPIAFIAQQAVDPVQRIKIQMEDQGIVIKEEGDEANTSAPPPRDKDRPTSAPQNNNTQNTPQRSQLVLKPKKVNIGAPEPSIKPSPQFSARADAELIKKAMKGKGPFCCSSLDEEVIISLIVQRSNQQRIAIAKEYHNLYGQDLIHCLESEMSGNFKESQIIRMMFKSQAFNDALVLHHAINEKDSYVETVLIEVLCTRTLDEIKEIKVFYKENYMRTLEEDIMVTTTGILRDILLTLCTQKLSFKEITDKIRDNKEEDFTGKENLAMCASQHLEYFADQLYSALTNIIKDDDTVIRIFVSRSEVDLLSIKQTFYNKYEGFLGREVSTNMKRDYKRLLLSMI